MALRATTLAVFPCLVFVKPVLLVTVGLPAVNDIKMSPCSIVGCFVDSVVALEDEFSLVPHWMRLSPRIEGSTLPSLVRFPRLACFISLLDALRRTGAVGITSSGAPFVVSDFSCSEGCCWTDISPKVSMEIASGVTVFVEFPRGLILSKVINIEPIEGLFVVAVDSIGFDTLCRFGRRDAGFPFVVDRL